MSNKKLIQHDIKFSDDSVLVNLWYPDVNGHEIKNVQIGLMDVRAADDIRIHFDKHRDGWVIEQASKFKWHGGDSVCDPDWQEVSFVLAWAREEKGG